MSGNQVYKDLCYNKLQIATVKFVFKISNFSERNEVVVSPSFPTSAPENIGRWRLQLIPNEMMGNRTYSPTQFISINIHWETPIQITARAMFSLIDDKGCVAKFVARHYNEDVNSGHIRLVDRGFVLDKSNCVLPNDELTIICDLQIRLPPENRFTAKFEPPPCRLAENWGNLLSSKSLTDVTIAVGGAELRAHKAVLAARSPVFAAMFSNQMLEKELSTVEVTDMDAEVFQAMLEFIYTGKEITQVNRAHDLLAAANKYQLERLKFMCEEALCKALTLDNVLENFALADLYNAPRLKEDAVRLVMQHRSAVFGSLPWTTLKRSHQSLATEILEKICLQEQHSNFLDYSNDHLSNGRKNNVT